jgi:hypothetical protein
MAHRKASPKSSVDDTLVSKIREFVQRHPPPKLAADAMLPVEEFRRLGFTPRALFPAASKGDVAKAEADLGFPLPQLLKRIYMEISNGIAGFSYDIIGLTGGYESHCGSLVDTYMVFKSDGKSENKEWKTGLLPYCHWGCNIFSCVDCTDSANPIFTYEDSGVWAQRYTLPEFFEMWLQGKALFSQENVEIVSAEIVNPFTGKKTTAYARSRRKPPT